jgi:hypothetical protein
MHDDILLLVVSLNNKIYYIINQFYELRLLDRASG